ncbi:MAG: bifunctional glutamate N-acetyltransferase/amino-acid acetyltransferase ArgJ [Chloroflexi bacterium]|nr:bifunctional glutamate N-acetyltransferase/amino-acid acetyltransferase ArgJ [Chloroflexota bacterium]MQC17013.1 bifunctional glutamate N-acetyltransferase/amino-acid acetyltransferase ArgJ [Chloroflexota bacterium]
MTSDSPAGSGLAFDWIEGGGITTPAGFVAGGTYASIKTYGPEPRLDVGILAAAGSTPLTASGVFTQNAVVGHSVTHNRRILSERSEVRGVVCNSGNANTVTGMQGAEDCARLATVAGSRIGGGEADVLVGSTGVIGRMLPMDRLEGAVRQIELTADGGGAFARAIMTTDTHSKECALRFVAGGRTYQVGGCAKGSGMIHPDMATMFGFVTTDAPVDPPWFRSAWKSAVDLSFNMVDVDMDTSTSDMGIALASGAAGGDPIDANHPAAEPLTAAMTAVATRLAKQIARDGEGATCLIEVTVSGAASVEDARIAARTVSSSPLMKTAVTGRDPNWGRAMMAVGRSGARVEQDAASVWIGRHCVLDQGQPTTVDLGAVSEAMGGDLVTIHVDLGAGEAEATAWGCNLTHEYVDINADYTT